MCERDQDQNYNSKKNKKVDVPVLKLILIPQERYVMMRTLCEKEEKNPGSKN